MRSFRYAYFIVFQLVIFSIADAQNIGIHAALVGEWQNQETFSPEYHYNSVAVYLLNEDRTLQLFNPENLSREERKQTGVRDFDLLESLYFSLQLPNPRRTDDLIDFPLYAFDIHQSKQFKVPRNQGKIIDRITDEELNGRPLNATAKIEAVKKNQLLEVAYQISSSLNKILANRLFNNPGISGVMRQAQEFFEDKYRGKIVSEFTVPILPGNEDFEYRLHSASIYQVKWDFQPLVKAYKGNLWSDLQDKATVTEADLKERPTRSSRFNKHPFLVVVRYKSAYSLPESHKLNVDITPDYLEKRLYNLQEFRKDGLQYRTEETFLEMLRDAVDLQRNVESYRRLRDKGDDDAALTLEIAQQYATLLADYETEAQQFSGAAADYFSDNYTVAYYKFFKQLDHLLFQDQQLREISAAPVLLNELRREDLKVR